ncbi:hypothetical protein B0H17DRAFT_1114560, partial [Mycena rosella]
PCNAPKSASVKDTANSLGLHDTLQYGPRRRLKERLENRNLHGMHAPMRLLMERKIPAHARNGQSNLHLDILMGRDETIEPVDIFGGMETTPPQDIHRDMEKKLKM